MIQIDLDKIVPFEDLPNRLSQVVDDAHNGAIFVVTKEDRPAVAIVSVSQLEGLSGRQVVTPLPEPSASPVPEPAPPSVEPSPPPAAPLPEPPPSPATPDSPPAASLSTPAETPPPAPSTTPPASDPEENKLDEMPL